MTDHHDEHPDDMTKVDREDDPAPTGSDEGADEMLREITSAPVAPVRPIDNQPRRLAPNAITAHLNRINDRNAGRDHHATFPEGRISSPVREAPPTQKSTDHDYKWAREHDTDTSAPVLGVLDLIEEINATSQRYGAFAHWPNDKKSAALALVTRTVQQHAIAQQVVAVNRRDTVHARAYRERRRLAREATTLSRTYWQFGNTEQRMLEADPTFYTEAINYLGRFVRKVAALPELPGEESEEKTDEKSE
jgi:hypothetical protein